MKPGWWLAAAVAAGLAAGIAWPPPPIPRSQKTGDSAWVLSTADSLVRLPPDAATEVGRNVRWLGEAADAGDGSQGGPWKLVGIMHDPAPAALIQLATGKIEGYTEGSTLPDGSTLALINEDEVTIERSGCAQVHRLHHPPPSESSDCIAKQ